jgi:hypothetical protein
VRTARIIEGEPFPWNEPNPAGEVVDSSGAVNWMAAAFADPGVTRCPSCGAHYWNEGLIVECLECHAQFETSNGQFARRHATEWLCYALHALGGRDGE